MSAAHYGVSDLNLSIIFLRWSSGFSLRSCRIACRLHRFRGETAPNGCNLVIDLQSRILRPELQRCQAGSLMVLLSNGPILAILTDCMTGVDAKFGLAAEFVSFSGRFLPMMEG